jgi:hypothetical protein
MTPSSPSGTVAPHRVRVRETDTEFEIHAGVETAAQLQAVARAEGRTVGELVAEGLAAYLASRNKLEALRAAIDEGDASGIAADSSLERIFSELRAKCRDPSQP